MASNHKLVCARAARRQFGGAFQQAVRDYRGAKLSALTLAKGLEERLPDGLSYLPLAFLYDEEVAQLSWEGSVARANAEARARQTNFRVMARTRPLQPQELEDKLYESISSERGNNAIVVHDGRVHRDGRTIYAVHSRFCLDAVFHERADNQEVFEEAVQPLLNASLEGGRATVVFFGQTGTGKTYTARGALDLMSERVFQKTDNVEMCCYEMAGTRGGREAFFDLLAGEEKRQVKCLTGEDGNVHVRGAQTIVCTSRTELCNAMDKAFLWRSSECTERNEASSRSHCILEFKFPGPDGESSGLFRVVDLAGSERNFETQMHSRSMAERGGLINYSLLMLKECARVMHNKQKDLEGPEMHVPFRSSRLTHLLRSSFTDDSHMTTVVATLSPSPTDVEHSLNTLQHVGMMRSARAWEKWSAAFQEAPEAPVTASAGFDAVQGRGRALHSKLQDARKGQLNLHAFQMKTAVGGSIMKKYEAQSAKTETFIDARWHRELNVKVQDDLWVLRDADAEATQILSSWKAEQWAASKVHDLSRWSAETLQAFLRTLDLPGEVRIPSTMTGAQLRRLGRRGLAALCSDAETAEALALALAGESQAGKAAAAAHRSTNIRMTALGNHKVHAAIEPFEPEIEPEAVDASTHAHAQHEPALATAAA
ncbi:DSK1 [Symbiodinium necroappetens]|uniref:DSK1 protein n=2 Tax=Symbiodinium TaxID=2949 RepID=A0A812P858_9DINO|nr:Diatom spindle kinesin-1 [Symbiodinium microadriaticum]CAE7343918.1 DSK1 [Symbiodinium necroappetens]CAE7709279.1 DSK1 [Symbiodinium microadriaticum]CAE7862625.1 DSK1 [Symbiodinium sp. KB8]|mmetsp:Transcript_47164/g.112018  ORF Transcript_47164/g.112018 Transcript_47164/m.112018 type:complete len:655 (-) Transcript_47164:155-2119(-)